MGFIKENEIENSYKGVVEKLKKARQDKGMSKYDLAKSAGLSQPMVTDFENGNKKASLMSIIRIARALNEIILL